MKGCILVFFTGILIFGVGLMGLTISDNSIYSKTTIWRTTADGIDHALDVYESATPSGGLKPAVIMCHGLAVSKEFFTNFGVEFAKLGYVAVSVELRGHGNSKGALEGLGLNLSASPELIWPDLNQLQNEIESAMTYLAARGDVNMSCISAMGHSMGGGAVLMASVLNPTRFQALIAIAPMPVDEINTTNARNFLLVIGGIDEAFSVATEAELFSRAYGSTNFNENVRYGLFADGSARELMVRPFDDHALEYIDPTVITECITWIQYSSFGDPNPGSVTHVETVYLSRLIWLGVIIVGIVLIAIWVGVAVGTVPSIAQTRQNYFQKLPDVRFPNEVIFSVKNVVQILLLSSVFGVFGLFALLPTGMFVSAAMISPMCGYALAIGITFRKAKFWRNIKGDRLDLLFGPLVGIGFFFAFFAVARFFTNILPLTRIAFALLYGGLLFVVLLIDEAVFRPYLQNRMEHQFYSADKHELGFWNRLRLFLGLSVFQFCLKIVPTLAVYAIMIYLMDNSFVMLLMVFLVLAVAVIEFLGVVWYYYTRRAMMNAIAFAIVFGLILVAISPALAPLVWVL